MFRTWTVALAGLGLALLLASPAGRAEDAKGKAILPFNGADLTGWKLKGPKERSKWVVGRAALDKKNPGQLAVSAIPPQADGGPGSRHLVNAQGRGVDIYSE